MTAPAEHPSWCTRSNRESADEAHSSKPTPINPSGAEDAALSVVLLQAWPPFDDSWWIRLTVTEDGDTCEHLITLDQATALAHALPFLVRLARTDRTTEPRGSRQS